MVLVVLMVVFVMVGAGNYYKENHHQDHQNRHQALKKLLRDFQESLKRPLRVS